MVEGPIAYIQQQTLLTFDDTEQSEASSCPAYEQVCTDSPEVIIREDYTRRMNDLKSKLDILHQKEQSILSKRTAPQSEISLGHVRRQLSEIQSKIETLEKTIKPFLHAVEKSSKHADEVKRRYLEQVCKIKTKTSVSNLNGTILTTKGSDRYCHKCKCTRYVDEFTNTYVCKNCATSVEYLDNHTSNVSYGKHCQFTKPLGYEHVNHFRKLLMHIQAKERTVVEREVINALRHEFSRSCQKTNNAHINAHTIRQKLKKIGRSDLYPNIAQIELILTGRLPVKLTEQQQRILIKMFHQHRGAFEKYKEKYRQRYNSLVGPLKKKGARKNLLYYSYLLGKFAEIRKWDWLRDRVNQLKSVDCLHHHDRIHREVCKILGWPFYETSAANKRNKINLLRTSVCENSEIETVWGLDKPVIDEEQPNQRKRKRLIEESPPNKKQRIDEREKNTKKRKAYETPIDNERSTKKMRLTGKSDTRIEIETVDF